MESQKILADYGLSEASLMLDDGSVLHELEVARHVPGKRCVCRAFWRGKAVYVKLFFGKNAKQYAMRDITGVGYLQQAKVATPEMLYQGEIKKPACYAVVFEAITSAKNAEDAWLDLSENARFDLAQKLVLTLAQHHQASLMQTDLYLKNFLVQAEQIYTLDGDGIRRFNSLPRQKKLQNLSVLLSKFDVLQLEEWLPELLEVYCKACALETPSSLAAFKNRINNHRRQAASAYADKKVFRQCTDVEVSAKNGLFSAVSKLYKVEYLPQTIDALDACFIPENIIKNGNTCTVATVNMGDRRVVIKRYNMKSFWHAVNRALRQTRAATSWANAHRLKILNIATATPVALIESRRFGLKGKAYFLAEHIVGPDAVEFFKSTRDKAQRAEAVKQIVVLFWRLYLLQISHGDMKATNIKMVDGKPALIDLDSMQQHCFRWRALRAHASDVRRFMQNWQDEPALYNAFVKMFKVIYKDNTPLTMANFQNIKS